MNEGLPRWELQIRGDEGDLVALARECQTPDLTVFQATDQDGYLLYSSAFDECADSWGVLEVGEAHLIVLSGVLKLYRQSSTRLMPGAVFRRRQDGLRDAYLHGRSAGPILQFGEPRVEVTDSSGKVLLCPESKSSMQSAIDLAIRDANVARVMRLVVAPDADSWTGLVRAVEAIEDDGYRQPHPVDLQEWPSKARLGLLKRTANSSAAGDASRHGNHRNTEPPPRPMRLDEACDTVSDLARAWVATRSGVAAEAADDQDLSE